MMHITRKASGYFENMWLWAADHMINDEKLDDANNTMIQTSIYAARGLLVESTEPIWFYGASSEHSAFYQYNFNGARNIFAAMIQSESPYFQPKLQAPSPFNDAVGALPSDPDYNKTAGVAQESWALVMRKSADVLIAGAGLYSWSSSFDEDCVDQQIQSVVTVGTGNMVVQEGFTVSDLDNLHVQTHPRWSYIANFDVGGNTTEAHRILNVNPSICDMDEPEEPVLVLNLGKPCNNSLTCKDDGRKTTHSILDEAIKSFCKPLKDEDMVEGYHKDQKTEPNIQPGDTRHKIVISLDVHGGCRFDYDEDLCMKYLLGPVDACNCGGKNRKQGGTLYNECYTWLIDPVSLH
ncbi:hypothetical protein NW754_008767 [Fusarium falciforme]|nr:hypothetical protein NW754_008767 [Fusarium falciforme]